ncbi:TetR/AcrR family transcriptional regulator [Limosilactobacillus sp. STM2_1]|uniref:TetR/AcrR family transcriptional regulator n=1 Tax=Limosilactobacillus rudii TaxID=2759755 RepID=A0A7W3UJ85_9LACO|nr:TetR/AcrR family transcriptional regulator [Limosilactobacillus rudii]MBB1078374.1 TetR/AcrR family transcriptional regulator [Limosilactobacillus rudii]MBB1096504.1 TetR/AcrR family transcriptional regulator [Limosilactobacillus rudii]MCD7134299.1 TetR/AcrR family transcriptional regulator [Limosilactobacillus rudii]
MDIRKINTLSRIKEGFISVLDTKKLSECTTNDIVDSAEVSKKTFYNYYQNKRELLHEIEDDLLHGLQQALELDREELEKVNRIPDAGEIQQLASVAFNKTLAFCNENKHFLSNLLSSNGDMQFYQMIVKLANDEFDARVPYLFGDIDIEKADGKAPLPFSFIRTLYINTIVNLLMLWGEDPDALSINEIKSMAGLIQAKSPIELIQIYKSYAN